MTHKSKEHDLVVLKWHTQHEDGLQLTPRTKAICGYFHPSIYSDMVRGWVPIKAMANINDKWGNREN